MSDAPIVLTELEAWKVKALEGDAALLQFTVRHNDVVQRSLLADLERARARARAYVEELAVRYGFDPAATWTLDEPTLTLRPLPGPAEPRSGGAP